MNRIAANFLTRSFASCETIALLLRREDAPRPQQRVVTVEQVLAPRYMAWLNFENDNGANIYVSANPLRSQAAANAPRSASHPSATSI